MKINKLVINILLMGLYSGFTMNICRADPVNINITGKVVASPCIVDTATSTLNVDLGNIQASTLNQAGNVSPYKIFDLVLKDCPSGTASVTATFSGALAPDGTGDYMNTGTATNVNVQLKESQPSGNGKFLGPGAALTRSVATDRTVTFRMGARAITATADVMPGTIVSISQVTFTYQ